MRDFPELTRAFGIIGSRIRPGDALFFYFVGHGYYREGTTPELPPVENSPLAALLTLDLFNEGDEFLRFNNDLGFSDNTLASLLSGLPHSNEVRKLVVIGACFSGGFWPDLSAVPNTAMISSVGEGEVTVGDTRGPYFHTAVWHALDGLAGFGEPSFSFTALASELQSQYQVFTNNPPADGIVFTDTPWLDQPIVVPFVAAEMNPMYVSTPDFDTNSQLAGPEPWCGPAIQADPTSTTVCPTGTATFTVAATSGGPLTYQWQHEVPAGSWAEQARTIADDGGAGDRFGGSVSVSGGTMVVGAPVEQAAYVYTRSGAAWIQQAKLTAPDTQPDDEFGRAVAVDGDTVLVGAPSDRVGANSRQGSCHVFTRSGGVWTHQAQLTAADGAANDAFGCSVAASGGTLLIGARNDAILASGQGSAYVYTGAGPAWTPQAKLTASDGAGSDDFGISVALSGDVAVIGAEDADVAGAENQGCAYVFARSGAVWSEQAKLVAPNGAAFDEFGISVGVWGDSAVVGAWDHDVGSNPDQGSIYVFGRSGVTWTHRATLTASNGSSGDEFGKNVAISGDVVVGAAVNVGANADAGMAYLFRFTGGAWVQEQTLSPSPAQPSDQFGGAVSLDGGTLVVGAVGDSTGLNSPQGSARVYAFDPAGTVAWADLAEGPLGGGPAAAANTQTATLAISSPRAIAPARFRCRLENSCGVNYTVAAEVTICFADINCSGVVSVQDIFDFLAAYFAGSPAADINGSLTISVQDIFDFLAKYFAGC